MLDMSVEIFTAKTLQVLILIQQAHVVINCKALKAHSPVKCEIP